MMRLDKFLANAGVGSRSFVKDGIKNGLVLVNGAVVYNEGFKVDDTAFISYDGERIGYKEYIYFMMNKPKGVITATEDSFGQKTVIDLLEPKYKKLFPVGRLDKDTTGLLLLTNDGVFAHKSLSPKKHFLKKYAATVRGQVSSETEAAFKNCVKLEDGYVCKSAELNILESGELSKVEVTISEGKYHQIKRMFETQGMQVLELRRVKFGEIALDETLAEGEYRELTATEFAEISSICSR